MRPSCQTTATSEAKTTRTVLRTQRVYQKTIAIAIRIATPKKTTTTFSPSMRSPTIFAKPVMWIATLPEAYLPRIRSSSAASFV